MTEPTKPCPMDGHQMELIDENSKSDGVSNLWWHCLCGFKEKHQSVKDYRAQHGEV